MVSGVIKKFEIQIFGVETIIETKVETLCLPISRVFSFLVQSFKETLQYCDEWRKFTSVIQSVIQSFIV